MHTITFKCQVITPMFMAGADGTTPELRPSEFKGMMRFWWRAIKAKNDIAKLKEEEAKIFGGVGKDEGRSKVRLQIIYDKRKFNEKESVGKNLKQDYKLKWYYDKTKNLLSGDHAGIGYLLYSTVLPNKERGYIKDKFNFQIIISVLDEESYKNALAAFWAAIYFGGFGTRARRGGGNITVTEVEGETYGLKFIPEGDDLKNWILDNLKKIKEFVGTPKDFCYAYSNLSFSRVLISKNEIEFWEDALNDIGKKYNQFRSNNKDKIFQTAVFGLPVVHKNTQIVSTLSDRRATPLIFKIIKFNNKYRWMLLRLVGEFLPEGRTLKSKKDNKTFKPDYLLIDSFWNIIKTEAEEIILLMPEKLSYLVNNLKSLGAKKIILFGSKARGDFHKKSDIDIAIEGKIKGDIEGNVDLVNFKEAAEKLKEKIRREGVVLYE